MTADELNSLARAIADDATRICFKSYAHVYDWDSSPVTYDISGVSPADSEWLDQAVRYLDARGQLWHDPRRPELVRLREA